MQFQETTASAKELRELYALLEAKRYGRSWSVEEIALGLVGDFGASARGVRLRSSGLAPTPAPGTAPPESMRPVKRRVSKFLSPSPF